MSTAEEREAPRVTVDVVVVDPSGGQPRVLLIRRANPPFQGQWAIPGGFVEPYEPLEAAARRELLEETGIEPLRLEQLHAFGDPGRDPRGWTITIAFLALLDGAQAHRWQPRAGSDAGEVGWFDLDNLPSLAFDHAEILACAAGRLSGPPA